MRFLTPLLILFVLFELGSRWYVSRALKLSSEDLKQTYSNDRELWSSRVALRMKQHPFFGNVDPEILDFDLHRPRKGKDEIWIGILGGSVARGFGIYANQKKTFESALRARIPEFRGKALKFVNLAISGGKQPQQYFVASYFEKDLDVIINIDGYNELKWVPSALPMEYPNFKFGTMTGAFSKTGMALLLARVFGATYRWTAEFLACHPRISGQCFTCFVGWNWLRPSLLRTTAFFQKKSLDYLSVEKSVLPENYVLEADAIWQRYTLMESRVIEGLGKGAFFFLQPNQYVPPSKPFSAEEEKLFSDPVEGPSATEIVELRRGYQLLRASLVELRSLGVKIYDLTEIFQSRRETLYSDSCCHVNDLGNEILGERIAEVISAEYSRQRLAR